MPAKRLHFSARPSIYRTVTDRIIKELREGRVPWVKPWNSPDVATRIGLPMNTISQKPYSSINILLLWSAAIEHGWASQRWLTFRQAALLGGHVRKGEHGETIVYAKRYVPKSERHRAERDGDEPNTIPMLKCYTVFNVAQCDGLPTEHVDDAPAPDDDELGADAVHLIRATGASVRHQGHRAFYNRAGDFICLPVPADFPDPLDYTRTLLHELGHWSGHASRLARTFGKRFGDEAYAREELVAEIACAYVATSLGIEPTLQHSSYLSSWLKVLEGDERAIFQAASYASAAADYLLVLCDPVSQPIAA